MIPRGAIELIQRFEPLRLVAERTAAGGWIVGHGHTSAHGSPMVLEGMRINEEGAGWILKADLERIVERLRPLIAVELAEHQHAALVSFVHQASVGVYRASTLRLVVNAGEFAAVPNHLLLWVKAGGQVRPELVARREAEGALWRLT